MRSRHIHNPGKDATDSGSLITNSIKEKIQCPSVWKTDFCARDSNARGHCSFDKSVHQQYPELKTSICSEAITTKKCGGHSFVSQKT